MKANVSILGYHRGITNAIPKNPRYKRVLAGDKATQSTYLKPYPDAQL